MYNSNEFLITVDKKIYDDKLESWLHRDEYNGISEPRSLSFRSIKHES